MSGDCACVVHTSILVQLKVMWISEHFTQTVTDFVVVSKDYNTYM